MKSLLMTIIAAFMLFSATCQEEEATPYNCDVFGPDIIVVNNNNTPSTFSVQVSDLPHGVVVTGYTWDIPDDLQIQGSANNPIINLINPGTCSGNTNICVDVHLSSGEYVRCCKAVTCFGYDNCQSACPAIIVGGHNCKEVAGCDGAGHFNVVFNPSHPDLNCIDLVDEICVSVEGIITGEGTSSACYDISAGEMPPSSNTFHFCSPACVGQTITASATITYKNGAISEITEEIEAACICQ